MLHAFIKGHLTFISCVLLVGNQTVGLVFGPSSLDHNSLLFSSKWRMRVHFQNLNLKKLSNGTNNFWITQGLPFPFVSQSFRTFQNSQLSK
jgi:hypothetical protein